MRKRLPIVLFLISSAACKSTNSTLDIVGGSLVRQQDPISRHTLALVETDGELDEYCTAVVIAENTALTAAHCFVKAKIAPKLFFGHSLPSSYEQDDKRFLDIEDIIIHPDFSQQRLDSYDKKIQRLRSAARFPDPEESLNDLALIRFSEPIPESHSPVRIFQGLPSETAGESIAAGFGCQSTDCQDYSGKLRKVELSFIKFSEDKKILFMSAGKGQGTCSGDSGGPDFVRVGNSLELLSIVSTGPKSCEAGISVETRIAPYLPWIESVIDPK